MNLLFLGGTVFLGRHMVSSAVQGGHNVTLFNRGSRNPAEQKDLERIVGDREKDLHLLLGRSWDAVIDTCGMDPQIVRMSAEALQESVRKYVFISSISAFDNFRTAGMNEKSPARLFPPEQEQDYGSRKAHCENLLGEIYGSRSLNIRPGLIVGPYDPSDRFTYWVRRVRRGGRILAPGRADRSVQFIDARDLSEWIIRLVEADLSGTFNATGPGFTLSMKTLLDKCKDVCGSNARFNWVGDDLLFEHKITPWSEMPLWIPESDLDFKGFMQIDCLKAQNRGLSYRTIDNTIDDILAWDTNRDQSIPLKAGLDPKKEADILASIG